MQVVRVDGLPDGEAGEVQRLAAELPLPPVLEARMLFDGWRIVRELHASSRSHVYLAQDEASGEIAVLKLPSIDMRDDLAYRERFLLEDWIARRIDSPHVLKPRALSRERHALYVAVEHVEGRTLAQWMVDHPRPSLDAVRDIVEQVAKGLRAFHRLEMLHQDLRPENVMIDASGTAKIIDFGAARVAGVAETHGADAGVPGTLQFAAPEYFVGGEVGPLADQFSLAVLAYQMLTGELPYGAQVAGVSGRRSDAVEAQISSGAATTTAPFRPGSTARCARRCTPIPTSATRICPNSSYELRIPNPAYLRARGPRPLIERNPLLFWKLTTVVLACAVVVLLALLHAR